MKKIIVLLFVLLCTCSLSSCNKKSDKDSYEIRKSVSYDGIFDYSPLCSYVPSYIYVENKSGRIDHAFSVDTDRNFSENSDYVKNSNIDDYTKCINVYFDYLQNYEGTINNKEAEYLGVQLAIFGRIKNFDPINLKITATPNNDFYNEAEWIRNFAHELYISTYVFMPNSSMSLYVYKDKLGALSDRVTDYSLKRDSKNLVTSTDGKTYWTTDYFTIIKGQTDYIEGARYTITLDNAPSGTMVVNAEGEVLGTNKATFDENSGSKGFRILIPYNQSDRGTIIVKVSGVVNRGEGIVFESKDSQTLIGLQPKKIEAELSFDIDYEGEKK